MNVIPFPVEAETVAIERAAIQLERREYKSGSRWWQTECRRLHARYTAIGFPDAECRDIVIRFARAVQREMECRAAQHHGNPGGAA